MKTICRILTTPAIILSYSVVICLFLFLLIPDLASGQWNPNTSVNLLISNYPTADMQSVPTTDGKTWIAFYHQNGGNYDMRAQLLDANGNKLLGPNGMLVDNKSSGTATYVFNVCVDAANNLIVAYQDQRTGTMQAVVYKISQAGTHLWGTSGIVLGGGLAPYPAALSNGEVAVAWSGDAGNTINLQKITTSGTTAWGTPIQVLVGSTGTTRGQIIANTGSKFTLVYQKKGSGISTTLYAQMFDNAGTALYTPLQICNQTTSGARYYSIAAEGDTTYFGYYSSSGLRFNSFLQRINPGGTIPWGMNGSNFNTSVGSSDSYQNVTEINLTPGSPYVWSVCTFCNPNQTQYGVYIQKFLKTSGARQFTDQAKVVYPISTSSDQQRGGLALVTDAPMFMSYDVDYKIYATRLNANGDFIWPGNRVELSSTTATPSLGKMRFGFTPDGPNRCAGVWTENRATDYMGYAQGVSIGGLVGLTVATQGGVPATITTNGGTLQMVATVFPATANQSVTWSIVPGTGTATISATGLVTAVTNGTTFAKATSVQDPTMKDSLLITMTGQTAQLPVVVTLAATSITSTGATLNGTVNANSIATTVSFNWGLTNAYGNTIAATPATLNGNTAAPVLANLTGLQPATTYHFRVTANNAAGTSNGLDLTFTTAAATPIVVSNYASNVGTSSVQLNGTVTANNSATTVTFDYGLTTSYGNSTAATPSSVAGTSPTAVLANLSSLQLTTLYHYRCVGVNSAGTTYGADMTFTTGCQTPIAPGTITGPATVCQNQTGVIYSVPPITNATSYNWTVPAGASITAGSGTNTITVTFTGTAVSGNVTVTGINSCATGPTGSMAVAVNSAPAPTITGTTSLCAGSGNYGYSTEAGMTNYTWTVTAGGTIVSGTGTNLIQVQWNTMGAQTVSVNYSNANGCQAAAPTTINITVDAVPSPAGAITGTNSLCAGTQGVIYSVAPIAGAGAYVWSVPAGATIVSGFSTNTITVDFSAVAVSGAITVSGNNLCGNGTPSSLDVTVNGIPPKPLITLTNITLHSNAPNGNQWYWDGTAVPGATGATYLVPINNPGWYWTVVTLNGCPSDSSNRIYVLTEGVNENNMLSFNISPVPNDGRFTVTIAGQGTMVLDLKVYNTPGVLVFEKKEIRISGTAEIPVNLGNVANGVYSVVLHAEGSTIVRKVLVNK